LLGSDFCGRKEGGKKTQNPKENRERDRKYTPVVEGVTLDVEVVEDISELKI
jgi:hypothetical protein